ncbi:MAG: SUF system NifU family Fe-S cluster assembly protein [Chloroflexota bacterium]|nr:SUF system NifU family Fe-S cluster assembly protein [Chloroflexota bacterium]
MSAHDLYREVILAHAQAPHNTGALPDACCKTHRDNPTCGDAIDLHADIHDGVIVDIRYESAGCAISTASASMMTDAVKGISSVEAAQLLANFRAFITTGDALDPALEELEALEGVRQLPARVKCALLAWRALEDVLAEERTEGS